MAYPDYNRRGYAAPSAAANIFSTNSSEYNSMHGYQQDAYNSLGRAAGGPRPLDWHVGGAAPSNAQGVARSPEPAYWSTGSTGPGALNTNYNYAATGSDIDAPADAAYAPRAYPQKQQPVAASAGPTPAYAATLLGPEIAGYKSVVTKNPVSPSGYSLAPPQQQQPPPSLPAGRQRSSISATSPAYQQHSQAPPPPPAADVEHNPANRSAAAAAAALAALGGNRTKSPQRPPASAGTGVGRPVSNSYSSAAGPGYVSAANADNHSKGPLDSYQAGAAYDYAGGSYSAAPVAEGPAALQWKLPARAPASAGSAVATPPAAHSPVAGRRVAAAPANPTSYAPSSHRSTAEDSPGEYVPSSAPGLRPPSQQRTEGLSKLKQLASARLASRITTPPTGDLLPPAAPATAPVAGRRSAGGYSAAATATHGWADRGGVKPQQQQQESYQRSQDYDPSSYMDYQYQPSSAAAPGSGRRSAARQAVTGRSRAPPQQQQQQPENEEEAPARPTGGAGAFGGYNLDAAAAEDEQPAGDEASEQCPSCGRRFNATAFDRHVKICDKVFGQKRKAFNVQAQRLTPEAAKVVSKAANASTASGKALAGNRGQQQQAAAGKAMSSKQLDSKPAVSAAAAKKSKWQAQSDQLRAAMRATQGGSSGGGGGGFAGGPAAPAYEEPDDRVLCPHCGRKFAELTAERHIPKCSEIIAKPKGLKAGGGTGAYMRNNPAPKRGR